MSKYKVGDKVVMKIISADQDEIKTYSVSGVDNNWRWCLPQNALERYTEPLSTYTEPLEAKIKRQAAEITRLLAENKRLKAENEKMGVKLDAYELYGDQHEEEYNQAFNQGAEAAWELAKKIVDDVWNGGYSEEKLKQIFGYAISQLCIVKNTYPEAAAKVEAWEKAKEEIKDGDVYRSEAGNYFAIRNTDGEKGVAKILFMSNGEVTPDYIKSYCTKTGHHIDTDSFLKQIGGEE